ncbi:polysaccharide biosynthesis protein [Sporolactobacillus sp. THM19-2]|uniref:putative polysaccharide biosynthesis protein n=1 Tax=Sporolactobacillus sp. THM19-2 TaxID=2511171 RepID=UPI00102067F4|nr:polysaccharide biosynthesis protein [Sporolactobacillus sp. THM19-2]RYL94545.1 polysaccharide biosynthesis protein [Sporolactobacillus sp. THM19-2]
MATSKMIRGTMILTVATFFSRFLGILFVIPYYWLTGEEGSFLYQYAYTPYAIMLSISTMGLPLAVSKFVSKYNALGDYEAGRRLLKSGIFIMLGTGLIGFLLMFFGAPKIADLFDIPSSYFDSVVLVIRVVSIAILIVPMMSLLRGYFQGFQSMGPTAVSQVVEQIVRVAFILIGAFVVVKVFGGSVVIAAALATFAAFVGAVAGLYVMMHYWVSRRNKISRMNQGPSSRRRLSLFSMYKELITYAIPFVAVGIAMQLYQLIDQSMAFHYLHYSREVTRAVIADLTMNDQKLVMIPVTLATSLAVSAVPAIVASYARGKMKDVREKITQALQLVLFLTVPAAFGLSVLGNMVHVVLYYNPGQVELMQIGGKILTWYAPTAILFALFQVLASIVQGINRQKVTLIALGAGVVVKILLNPVCMKFFGMIGPVIATNAGYALSIMIIAAAVRKATAYTFSLIAQQVIHIVVYTTIMILLIRLIFFFFGGSFTASRFMAFLILIISVLAGAAVYLLLARYTGLLRKVLGKSHKAGSQSRHSKG